VNSITGRFLKSVCTESAEFRRFCEPCSSGAWSVFLVFFAGLFLAQVDFRCGFCAVQSLLDSEATGLWFLSCAHKVSHARSLLLFSFPGPNPFFCAALWLEILAFVLGHGVRCWSGESTDQTLRSISVLAAVLLASCSVFCCAHCVCK
jgi:hypothetical protein